MEIKISRLEDWDTNKYGYYQDMTSPSGECFSDTYFSFYHDLVAIPGTPTGQNFSLSICEVKKRPMLIDTVEYHSTAYEMLMPLDGDILIHVIPASQNGALPIEKTEVFLIPKNTLVILKSGVWHHAPYTYDTKKANVLIGLPERTYANDCVVQTIDIPIQIMMNDGTEKS